MEMENKPNRIIWHHSADSTTLYQASKIDSYHKSKGFPKSTLNYYGGYHILIEKDGKIVRFRQDSEIGAHDAGENVNSLGICLAGNFDIEEPTTIQVATLRTVLLEWMQKWSIPTNRIEPHRLNDNTHCPGLKLPDDWAQRVVAVKSEVDHKAFLLNLQNLIVEQLSLLK